MDFDPATDAKLPETPEGYAKNLPKNQQLKYI